MGSCSVSLANNYLDGSCVRYVIVLCCWLASMIHAELPLFQLLSRRVCRCYLGYCQFLPCTTEQRQMPIVRNSEQQSYLGRQHRCNLGILYKPYSGSVLVLVLKEGQVNNFRLLLHICMDVTRETTTNSLPSRVEHSFRPSISCK